MPRTHRPLILPDSMRPQVDPQGRIVFTPRSGQANPTFRRATQPLYYPLVHETQEDGVPATSPQVYTISLGLLAFSVTAILLFAPLLGHLLGRLASLVAK